MNDKGISVLEQYDFQVIRTGKGRGSVLCETVDGLKMLKEYKGSLTRLDVEDKVLNHLKQQGVLTDSYAKNKTNQVLSIDSDGTKYTIKNWFEGRELDVKNIAEILQGAKILGRLHNALIKIPEGTCESLAEVPTESLEDEMIRHHRELKRVRTFIRNKHKKEAFEIHILKNYEQFYAQGEDALSRLRTSFYEDLRKTAKEQVTLCHGNYNQHNIWICQKKPVITNFEKMCIDLQIMDLYLFMRKILEKYNWDSRLGKNMIEEYEKERTLTPEEKEVLSIMLSYPIKFWKIVNHYQSSNKVWIPKKDLEKLENLIKQDEEKEKFLRTVFP